MTVVVRKTSPQELVEASPLLESFNKSSATLQEKYNALRGKHDICGKNISETMARITRWNYLIEEAHTERSRYSENANKAIDRLITQAENHRDSSRRELEIHRKYMDSILNHLSTIEEMIIRLKNAEYEVHISESYKGLESVAPESYAGIEGNLKELEQDIRRLEYTSEALLEIGEAK